jgi:hypothetical protein
VTVAKRDPRGFTVTNSVQPVRTPPEGEVDLPPTPEPTPESTAETTPVVTPDPALVEPSDPGAADPEPDPGPQETLPSLPPAPEVAVPAEGGRADGPTVSAAGPPSRPDTPGPLTTTAPYTLRGAFVWAPLLLLSVLALRLRFPWRYKRRRRPLHR